MFQEKKGILHYRVFQQVFLTITGKLLLITFRFSGFKMHTEILS